MRVALFDDVGAGHRPAFMAGLAGALAEEGHRVSGVGSEDDDGGHRPEGIASWHRVPLTPVTAIRPGRAMLAEAVQWCVREGVTVWCDLDLNRNILRVDRRLLAIPHRVHIIHRVDRPFRVYRSTLGRLRTYYSRRRLRWLARHGSRFAVHTKQAHDYLTGFLPAESVAGLSLPVEQVPGAPAARVRTRSSRPVQALFVGKVRPDRGFPTLLDALEELPGRIDLHVVGRQVPGFEERMSREHPDLEVVWENRYVSREELRRAYERAELVVLPYDASNSDSGSSSMVLLEAMAHGVPVVGSPAVGQLLPADFEGAIVAEAHDAAALARALERAVAGLPELAVRAAEDGPRIIRERHSYRDYARGLLEAAVGR